MKQCRKCHQIKPKNEFYQDKRTKDGLYSHCKVCHRDYYLQNIDSIKKKCKRYYQENKNKCIERAKKNYNREQKTAYDREYRKTIRGIEVRNKSRAKYNQKNQFKRKARIAVNNAVKLGKLPPIYTRQCVICSNPANDYHHHKGYSQENWLNVIPLCKSCHKD